LSLSRQLLTLGRRLGANRKLSSAHGAATAGSSEAAAAAGQRRRGRDRAGRVARLWRRRWL